MLRNSAEMQETTSQGENEMFDTYENIELFGLTENGSDDLPIPNDEDLADAMVRECFESLITGLQGTGLQSEMEPLAHAFATMLQRRAKAMEDQADRLSLKIRGLIEAQDGSEIAEVEMEKTQRAYEVAFEKHIALELMAEKAAQCYEAEIGSAYTPVTGNRTSKAALETGAVFEAKQLLEQHDKETAERTKIEGIPLIVSGATDWNDVDTIFTKLDIVRDRIKQTRNSEIFLCHKGGKGAELIAARWARARGIQQAKFDPRWSAHGKAAPFKCNDEMLDDKFAPVGVVLFGGNGVALNLGQKAEEKGIKVMRVEKDGTVQR